MLQLTMRFVLIAATSLAIGMQLATLAIEVLWIGGGSGYRTNALHAERDGGSARTTTSIYLFDVSSGLNFNATAHVHRMAWVGLKIQI